MKLSFRDIPPRIFQQMPYIFDRIPEIEAINGDVSSTTLRYIGLLSKDGSRARQLDELGLRVRSKSRKGNGFVYFVAKEEVMTLLRDLSELVLSKKRLSVPENPCQQSPSPQSVEKIQRDFVATVDALYELQQENHRLIQDLLKKSPARTTDLDRLIAKLAAMEEVHLEWKRQNRDLLERCEGLLEKTHDYHNIQKEQNRCLLKSLEKVAANLSRMMESFEITPV